MADHSPPESRSLEADQSGARRPPEADKAVSRAPTREPNELYRLLVSSVRDYAIFALDANGYILTWNPGAERFKGYTAEEAIGRHFSMFYPKERVEEGFPDRELREAARHGRFEDEGWRIRKDGSRFWANVVITALRDSRGKLVGFAKVTRDLSERREAEETLRESEERFRLLVQGVRDYAIFLLDPAGHITTWNEGAERIEGYRAEEIIGRHFSTFYPQDDIDAGKPPRELEIASLTGKYEEEGWRVRKDGSLFWSSVLITALRKPDGTLAGFAKVTRDLTERRSAQMRALEDERRIAAEEAARRTAEQGRQRTEELQTITSALSAARTIPEISQTIVNDGFRAVGALAGALALEEEPYGPLSIVCSAGYRLLPEWAQNVVRSPGFPMSDAIRTGSPVVFRGRDERDRRYPVLADLLVDYDWTAVFPVNAAGRPIGALAMHGNDASAVDDDGFLFMQAFVQQCAQAVDRALLYVAEQDARLRADEANRAKSEFLAAMSHELRTPLNAIAGYADLIDMGLRGPVTGEQRADLQRIKRSQQHLLGIINDILNFSRIEAGQMVYDLGVLALHDVLESVGHMITPQADAKSLLFDIVPCARDAIAWADRAKVEQILLNLLSNAVKFTPSGGRVSLRCDSSNASHVELVVQDTGVGIPVDNLERIFEPFVQVGRSLTTSQEGTGLGLAISRDLARAMRGDITVESAAGTGSTFTLTLPKMAED